MGSIDLSMDPQPDNKRKESELTRLKKIWLTLDEPARDDLRKLLSSDHKPVQKCHEIGARFRVGFTYLKQLYRFQDWVETQDALALEAETMAEEERQLIEQFGDKLPMDKIREVVLRRSYARSLKRGNFDLGLRTMRVDQFERTLQLNREKHEFDAAAQCLLQLPELKLISNNSKLTDREKINQIRRKLFGRLPEDK
jgi:hypothetical protein